MVNSPVKLGASKEEQYDYLVDEDLGDYYPRDSKSTSAYARSIQRTKAQKRRAFLKWGTVGLVAVLFVLGVVGIFSPDTEATSLTSSSHAASAQGQELLADTDDYVSPPSNDIVDLSSFEPIEEDPTASPIESTHSHALFGKPTSDTQKPSSTADSLSSSDASEDTVSDEVDSTTEASSTASVATSMDEEEAAGPTATSEDDETTTQSIFDSSSSEGEQLPSATPVEDAADEQASSSDAVPSITEDEAKTVEETESKPVDQASLSEPDVTDGQQQETDGQQQDEEVAETAAQSEAEAEADAGAESEETTTKQDGAAEQAAEDELAAAEAQPEEPIIDIDIPELSQAEEKSRFVKRFVRPARLAILNRA